ncbi:MAG: tRNA glutamyl-Q(34) synthetase GluQRS, partial [Boseongicola sp.]|nr:tRNA glutamyl-Q(34) synthetase GluQRS [Boseongicola sp.]
EQIYDDLTWLGLSWENPVLHQADQLFRYRSVLSDLWRRGLLFPCNCSRRDIADALSAPQEISAAVGPDGPVYPGTCRHLTNLQFEAALPENRAIRLSIDEALEALEDQQEASFEECLFEGGGIVKTDADELKNSIGDIVLARKDMGTSYHLAVVLDDAEQGITDVVRGEDLFEATKIHALLQRLLGLPTPRYHHHRLIRDEDGKRLAKRDDARALNKFRKEGYTPDDIRDLIGLAV